MKHRSIVLVFSILMGVFITTPTIVHAEEDTPTDAPYQESMDDSQMAEAIDETPQEQPEEASPTLPSAYNSPMTAADPTLDPSVQVASTEGQGEGGASLATADTTVTTSSSKSFKRRSLPVALTATLTPRAIRNSRVWSQATAPASLKTTLYASSRLAPEQATDLQRNGAISMLVGSALAMVGGILVLRRKRHA